MMKSPSFYARPSYPLKSIYPFHASVHSLKKKYINQVIFLYQIWFLVVFLMSGIEDKSDKDTALITQVHKKYAIT